MNTPALRALIVEDERLTRTELAGMIRADGRLAVVGEASTLDEARALLERLDPEVVFLDIHLGVDSGFTLLEACDHQQVVFVSAHDAHAVRAFEVNALDYLLKPVAKPRLTEAIDRVVRGRETAAGPELPAVGEDDRLFLRVDDRWVFLRVGDIALITAEGNYCRIRTTAGSGGVVLKSLQEWETRLPHRRFARIHRSMIANIDLVEKVVEWSNYSYRVHLRGVSEPIGMSRRYAAKLKRLLG